MARASQSYEVPSATSSRVLVRQLCGLLRCAAPQSAAPLLPHSNLKRTTRMHFPTYLKSSISTPLTHLPDFDLHSHSHTGSVLCSRIRCSTVLLTAPT